jgi:hypothetical protein
MIHPRASLMFSFVAFCCAILCPEISPAKDLASDSFGLSKDRTAGATLDKAAAGAGGGTWTCAGNIVFGADGGITPGATGAASMAFLPLPATSKIVTLSADVKSEGKGYVILALLPNNDPGQFWKTAALWVSLRPLGNWTVLSNGTTLVAQGTPVGSSYQFKEKDFNHIELQYDPATKSVTLTINGTIVVAGKSLKDPLPPVTHAAIRFNEPVTEKTCVVKNFSFSEAD